eukprot:6808801-Ditylum_brightwellii.AAC.1
MTMSLNMSNEGMDTCCGAGEYFGYQEFVVEYLYCVKKRKKKFVHSRLFQAAIQQYLAVGSSNYQIRDIQKGVGCP